MPYVQVAGRHSSSVYGDDPGAPRPTDASDGIDLWTRPRWRRASAGDIRFGGRHRIRAHAHWASRLPWTISYRLDPFGPDSSHRAPDRIHNGVGLHRRDHRQAAPQVGLYAAGRSPPIGSRPRRCHAGTHYVAGELRGIQPQSLSRNDAPRERLERLHLARERGIRAGNDIWRVAWRD